MNLSGKNITDLKFFQRFNRFEVSRVCLDCMLTVPEHSDRHITRMAVAIVSVLACKVCMKILDKFRLFQATEKIIRLS